MCRAFDAGLISRQGKMSHKYHMIIGAVAAAVALTFSARVLAQSDEGDAELRIQRLENQLRQLTGQNEELQYRNLQLEERLRQLQGGVPPPGASSGTQPNVATVPSAQTAPSYGQPPVQGGQYQPTQGGYAPPAQGGYAQPQTAQQPQIASPAPIVQEPAVQSGRRRGDAFDPSQNPGAPGAPKALGGGPLTIPAETAVGPVGGRSPGEPLDLAGMQRNPQAGAPQGALPPPNNPSTTGGLAAPPSGSARDEYDLGIGYMQRKDYALAEETMRNFAQQHPNDPLMGESQYWLGESYFQRQQYRDAAETFLNVTSKYEKSPKAPDALLRLGQSLAALKEREASCAALGEVTRKYPRASAGVKAAVDRELKKEKC
jgi:tol-pal system protein YbgF